MLLNKPLNLAEKNEWLGEWSIPDAFEGKVLGSLKHDGSGGITLELYIDSRNSEFVARNYEVIHGTSGVQEITLLGVRAGLNLKSIPARFPHRVSYKVDSVIIGARVKNRDSEMFSKLRVSIEDTNCWSGASEISYRIPTHSVEDSEEYGVFVVKNNPVPVEVDGKIYRVVSENVGVSAKYQKGETFGNVRAQDFWEVSSPPLFSLDKALEEMRMLQGLLSFAACRVAGVIWIQLEVAGTEGELPDGTPLPPRRVNVISSLMGIGQFDLECVDPRHFLFSCDSIPFEVILPKWICVYEDIRVPINMILAQIFAPMQFIENTLLMIVGTAEVLHKNLNISRARSLKERLVDLASTFIKNASPLLIPDIPHWATRTVKARNGLTHEGKADKHSVDELITIIKVTRAVITLAVMEKLEISGEHQKYVVENHPQFIESARYARDWLTPPPEEIAEEKQNNTDA
ncbi:HEPN domain-containing protein [uncultured Rothia sp.]|uniref:ApeA N-terminal domain 1-containing protein n=1 Tax=uncultured Rothia sp. TaxID=316088 RepID=UPI00260D2402|nr:HEPN domain-containing protein [uncultured Rothia sp.]